MGSCLLFAPTLTAASVAQRIAPVRSSDSGGYGRLPAGVSSSATTSSGGSRTFFARAFRMLRARGSRLERDFPFGVVTHLFDGVVARERATGDSAVLSGAVALAAPLFGRGALVAQL